MSFKPAKSVDEKGSASPQSFHIFFTPSAVIIMYLLCAGLGAGSVGDTESHAQSHLRSGVTLRFWAVAPRLLKAAPGMVSLNRPER